VHEISILYGELYKLGSSLTKRERFSIHKTTEEECLCALKLSIEAALERKGFKMGLVRGVSVQVEVLKHLVRSAHANGSIALPVYIEIQKRLQSISRMSSGWLKYLERNEAPS